MYKHLLSLRRRIDGTAQARDDGERDMRVELASSLRPTLEV